MRSSCFLSRAVIAAVALGASSCAGSNGPASSPSAPRTSLAVGAERPSLSVVERAGDARGAVAIAVTTEGIAPDRGAAVAVALESLVEERLTARGLTEFTAVAGWDGWRLRAMVASPAEGARLVDAAREAMLAPVDPKDAAMPAVARKVDALARRPLPDPALADVARCTGEAYGTGEATPTAAELDLWRRAAHGFARVAVATAGDASLAEAVAAALARAPAWPRGAPVAATPWPDLDAASIVYDASGEIPAGAARIVVTARTTAPERAVAVAPALGDPRGALASRLAALDTPARIRSVVATAHVDGGCIAATLDLSPQDLTADAPARIATAAALARQELLVEVADVTIPPGLARALALRASDPRDAAERSAWWKLAARRAGADDLRPGVIVGVAARRDATGPTTGRTAELTTWSPLRATRLLGDAIRSEMDRATTAWRAPVVEARTRVERGQGEAWVLLASPCGTLPEARHDAGTGAAVAMAAVMRASEDAGDAQVEPFVITDGVGVMAHGAAHVGESSLAQARRLGDVAARAFAADALDSDRLARARALLLARGGDLDARMLAALGDAIAPGRPAWIEPWGTLFGLGSATDDAIAMRASAIRAGPLRVAVLANVDTAQAEAAVRAVDRWVARRPGEARACPTLPTLPTVHAGTYGVEIPAKGLSEALLAFPLPPGNETARSAAAWFAAALDGPDGMIARAMGLPVRGERSTAPLAHAWSAAVIGAPRSPALVIRLVSSDALLDASVAQIRALLDRLRQGAFRAEDRVYAAANLARAGFAASLDPRARTIGVWLGENPFSSSANTPSGDGGISAPPTLDALRVFASELHDESLVIVAARPARSNAERPSTSRESKGASRESTRP